MCSHSETVWRYTEFAEYVARLTDDVCAVDDLQEHTSVFETDETSRTRL